MERYAAGAANAGFTGALRWEDGKVHRLPQDYADMAGWQELSNIVNNTCRDLPESMQSRCLIRALNYGEAGAIRFHTRKSGLPEPVCYSESFCLWAPDSISPSCAIYVIAEGVDLPALNTFFGKVEENGRVTDCYAREQGTKVLLCTQPRDTFKLYYKTTIRDLKAEYGE